MVKAHPISIPYQIGIELTSFMLTTCANCNDVAGSQIVYAGKVLLPFTRYSWSVTWTASTGATSAPSTARFETGPLSVGDWQGAGWLNGTFSFSLGATPMTPRL